MDKKLKKGIDIGAIILVVIIFLLGAAILSLKVTQKTDGVPRVLGVTFLDIKSDSMKGVFENGDIAVITKVKSDADLKVGDVITFWDFTDVNNDGVAERVLNTHRITAISDGAIPQYTTKGDNTLGKDDRDKVLTEIVGKYHFRLPNAGFVVRFLQSIWGFLLVVVLPLSAFLIYRIYVLVKVILQIKSQKQEDNADADALKAELEALRAKVAHLENDNKQ